MTEAKPCPVCGAKPDVDETDLRNGWHAGCYGLSPDEHYIGATGDTRGEAVRKYNAEVQKIIDG